MMIYPYDHVEFGANPEARNLRGEKPCELTDHPHTLNLLRASSAGHTCR